MAKSAAKEERGRPSTWDTVDTTLRIVPDPRPRAGRLPRGTVEGAASVVYLALRDYQVSHTKLTESEARQAIYAAWDDFYAAFLSKDTDSS